MLLGLVFWVVVSVTCGLMIQFTHAYRLMKLFLCVCFMCENKDDDDDDDMRSYTTL